MSASAPLADYARSQGISVDALREMLVRGQTDPVWWMRNVLGFVCWEKQRQIAESLRDHRKTAVPACHAPGKSALAGALVLWFNQNFVNSLVITTAPTERQVRRVLWKEIRSRFKNARVPLAGELTTLTIEVDDEWAALGFATSDYDPNKFNGYHAEQVLVVIDEACGISNEVYDGVAGVMSGGESRLLMLGNPVDPNTRFKEECESSKVNVIPISAYDTPNFNIPGHELTEAHFADGTWEERLGPYAKKLPYPYLTTPVSVEDLYTKGPTHPTYVARVLGRFPDQSEDSLLSIKEVEDAQEYEAPYELVNNHPMTLALDVARGGQDSCVMVGKQGRAVRILDKWKKCDTHVSAKHSMRIYDSIVRHGGSPEELRIDVGGLGAGVFDHILHARTPDGKQYPVVPFDGSYQEGVPDEFENMRAWGYSHLADILQQRQLDLDTDPDLRKQLLYIKTVDRDGNSKILIMGKVAMRNKGFMSPDEADAVMMACAPGLRAPGDSGITV